MTSLPNILADTSAMRGFNWVQEILDDTLVFVLVIVLVFALIGFMLGKLLPGLFGATITFLYLSMQIESDMLNQFAWIIAIIIIVIASFRLAGFVLGGGGGASG